MILARVGDKEGDCTQFLGCAQGNYYMRLNYVGGLLDPDPILELQNQYTSWARGPRRPPRPRPLAGSRPTPTSSPRTAKTAMPVTVKLVDVDGTPLTVGGATVTAKSATNVVAVTPVVDQGDGSYTFFVRAKTTVGLDEVTVEVDDGTYDIQLYPPLALEVEAPTPLHAGRDELSAAEGGAVPFTLDAGPSTAGTVYLIAGSASGTVPGTLIGDDLVPLNFDAFTQFTVLNPGPPALPGTLGTTNGQGRATAAFDVAPGVLAPLVGLRLDWAAVVLTAPLTVTNADGFDIVP